MSFYCKPEIISSWFIRHGALARMLYNGLWKSDNDLLKAFHSNFLSGMHGFRDDEVLLSTGYDVMSVIRQWAMQALFHAVFWKSDHDLLAFHNNFFIWDVWTWRYRDISTGGLRTHLLMD